MGKRAPAAIAAAALLAVLFLPGCGEGDGTSAEGASSGAGEISKAEFRGKANRLCAATFIRVRSEITARLNGTEEKEGERAAAEAKVAPTVMAPALLEEAERLEALGSPSGDKEQLNAIFDAIREASAKAEEYPNVVVGNGKPLEEAEALADRYGLLNCPYG